MESNRRTGIVLDLDGEGNWWWLNTKQAKALRLSFFKFYGMVD